MGDAHKLEIAQFPTSGVQADYPAQFMVRKNGAVGQLDAKVRLQCEWYYLFIFSDNLVARESITRSWKYVNIKYLTRLTTFFFSKHYYFYVRVSITDGHSR